MEEAAQLRSKYRHFRVLVIGRANAGKTTLLKAVCGTTEAPQVYNQRGRRITAKKPVLSPTSLRGVHNIEYELRFHSNPGFVFHDSRGFEAGATEELEKVREFINNRAAERSVNKQLHAIWFCIPTDHDARMLTAAELDFFQRCDTGKVPVIVIFTKFDSLDSMAYQELRREGFEHSEAQNRAPRHADEYFKRVHLNRILEQKYPPKGNLCVRNMQEVDNHEEVIKRTVTELLEKTSDALDTNALKLLLVTVQDNNIGLCTKNFVDSGIITTAAQEALESGVLLPGKKFDQFVWSAGIAYPYIWYRKKEILDSELSLWRHAVAKLIDMLEMLGLARKVEALISRWPLNLLRNHEMVEFHDGSLAQFIDMFTVGLAATLPRLNRDLPPPLQALNLGACAAICTGALCWKRTGIIGAEDLQRMLEHYEDSGASAHVRVAIREGFDDVGPYDTMERKEKLLQIILDHKDIGPVPE